MQETIKQINAILNDTLIKYLKQNNVSEEYTGEAICVEHGEIIYNGETFQIFNDSFYIRKQVFCNINKEVCNILAKELEKIKGDFEVNFNCYLEYIDCEGTKFLESWREFHFTKNGDSCNFTSEISCPSLYIDD